MKTKFNLTCFTFLLIISFTLGCDVQTYCVQSNFGSKDKVFYSASDDICYILMKEGGKKTWGDALTHCKNIGTYDGRLAMFERQSKWDFIEPHLTALNSSISMMIGMRVMDNVNRWSSSITDLPLEDSSCPPVTQYPSVIILENEGDDRCFAVDLNLNTNIWRWLTIICSSATKFYICEIACGLTCGDPPTTTLTATGTSTTETTTPTTMPPTTMSTIPTPTTTSKMATSSATRTTATSAVKPSEASALSTMPASTFTTTTTNPTDGCRHFDVANAIVTYDVLLNRFEVNCNTKYLLRGNSVVNCDRCIPPNNGSKYTTALPICQHDNMIHSYELVRGFALTSTEDINLFLPSAFAAFTDQTSSDSIDCALLCDYNNRCISAEFNLDDNRCKLYDFMPKKIRPISSGNVILLIPVVRAN